MSGRGRGRGRGSGPMSQSKLLLRRSAQEAGLDNDREMMSIQEIVRPSLYPDIMWQSSGNQKDAVHPTSSNPFVKMEEESETPNQTQEIVIAKRPASVVSMIQKQRQLFEALNKSSHFVQQNPMTDVARYGQQTVRTAPDQNVLLSMSGHQGITPINNNDEHESEAEAPPVITSGSLNHQKVYSKLATDERYFPAELLSTRKQLESAREARNPQRKTLTDLLEEEEKTQDTDDPLQEEDEEGGGEELEDLEEEEVEDYTTNYYDSEGDASDGDGDGEATF